MRDPVETYFTALRDIHASGAGVAEVSYYGPLEQLLNDIGSRLKPKVRAFMQLANRGAGNPDGGLFTASQYHRQADSTPLEGQPPARGAIEVKGTADDVLTIAASPQVARYVEHYGLVLVTNLRDFVLVGRGPGGEPRTLESCQLATTEAAFWGRIAQPRTFADQAAEGLTEFLRRVMLHNAPLTAPKDVAWFLASYARTARLRLEHRELPALDQLRDQLEQSLGLKFEGERGDHFFRSTLVQTLFYGMFASWVLWTREQSTTAAGREGRFEWETASATLHVPMVSELFYQFSNPGKLRDLHIAEVLEWAEEVLNRVDRTEFFRRFAEEHAVQYFYEPFLEAFDPQLRKDLGVWYTPDEVVKYMVARVDWALREELDIADGLADPSVYVLDPCCGTGAYLVEVLRKIDETLTAKGADALTRHDVKRAAMERVIGFEIMPAPFVIAHLQLGLLLSELGVPLSSDSSEHERAAVYLTNALTGWNNEVVPPKDKRVHENQIHSTVLLSEFAEEKDAANQVKREAPVLVVIGNPPYNGFAGVAQDEEASLLRPFKERREYWGVKKNKLDDLYLRFFAMAHRRVAKMSGRGIVSFIANDSWLSGPSYVTVREELLNTFDAIWIEGMHGDRSMSEYGPDGRTSQTVFAIAGFSPGIRQGIAISTWVKRPGDQQGSAQVLYRNDINESDAAERRRHLLETLADNGIQAKYEQVFPAEENRLSFRSFQVAEGYLQWPSVVNISRVSPLLGLNENRGEALTDLDATALAARMRAYFDSGLELSELPESLRGLTKDWARFDAAAGRQRILSGATFSEDKIKRFQVKPFDEKWAYLEPTRPLWNEPRPDLLTQLDEDAEFVLARVRAPKANDGAALGYSRVAADQHALHKDAYHIPVTLRPKGAPSLFMDTESNVLPNLDDRAQQYLVGIGLPVDPGGSRAVWMHVLAVGYSPAYLHENADGIAGDWPRIPMPNRAADLSASAELGSRIAGLLDPSSQIDNGEIGVGALTATTGGTLAASDLGVTVQWGLRQRAGVTTPSTGKLIERQYTSSELAAIAQSAESIGITVDEAIGLLGETCYDVYLNDVAYWRCVPASVWRYTIGGYQVIKKWLSYRERALLGRDLHPVEARYVTEMVRRIAALVLMGPELDANYERVKADVWEW